MTETEMATGEATAVAPLISLRNVGLSYWLKRSMWRRQRFWALKDVSFDLYKGDSLGVVGKNGAGKSTLLRLLANVMSPDRGTVSGASSLRISLLSLQLGFLSHLNGRENAILSGMFLGMSKREIQSRMERIIEFAELKEFIDQPLSTYSSGMRARLGFAVAFQVEPDVLLVDEITGVGDAAFQERSFGMMKERLSSQNSTVVFVSHSAATVRSLCNRAVWIEEGVVRAQGDVVATMAAYEDFLKSLMKKK
jgi:lipopolysaccharide transport system ATP-binding protein